MPGLQYGKNVREFLDGLVARRLAAREACRGDRGYLYHLHARSIYRALQQDDNRNRRRTSLAAIGRKLMLLDFVIGQPGVEWFATEADKVALFTQRFGVPAADLPQRSYAAYGERTDADHPVLRAQAADLPGGRSAAGALRHVGARGDRAGV